MPQKIKITIAASGQGYCQKGLNVLNTTYIINEGLKNGFVLWSYIFNNRQKRFSSSNTFLCIAVAPSTGP